MSVQSTIQTLAAISLLAVLASCSQKPYSDLFTHEYAPLPRDSVAVVAEGDTTVGRFLPIGRFMVPGGTASSAAYERVLGQAVDEAARSGANLLIVHLPTPYTLQSGEWATLARCSVRPAASRQPSAASMVAGAGPWQAAQHGAYTTDSLATPQHRRPTDSEAARQLGLSPVSTAPRRRKKQPVASLKVGVGPQWTVSKVYGDDSGDYESGVRGTGVSLSFTSLPGGWYGFGFDFYGSHTSFGDIRRWGRHEQFSISQYYFGPAFCCGGVVGGNFRLEANFGLGIAVADDPWNTEVGLGLRSSLGAELMLSRRLGIGVEVLSQRHRFSTPDGVKLEKGEWYGYQQLGLLLGLRVYF